MNPFVLYADTVELYGWSKSSASGNRVKFRLAEREHLAHFESERPMRRSRTGKPPVGALFCLTISPVSTGVPFDVIGWYKGPSWSTSAGALIQFELSEDVDLLHFINMVSADGGEEGEELALVVVQLDDEGNPVDQVAKRRVMRAASGTPIPKGGPKSKHCARKCEDPEFVAWFLKRERLPADATPAQVAARVRDLCEIDSRAELDHKEDSWRLWRAIESEFIRATRPL